MRTEKFMRKTFPIDAVQVTEENMEEVAQWCKGVIETTPAEIAEKLSRDPEVWIRVKVHNPLDDRQTQAFVGDWVLYTNRSYKCYRDRPFKRSFEPVFRGEVGEADNQETNRRIEAEISATSGQHQNHESVKDKVFPKGLRPRPARVEGTELIETVDLPDVPESLEESLEKTAEVLKELGVDVEKIEVAPTGMAVVIEEDPIAAEMARRGLTEIVMPQISENAEFLTIDEGTEVELEVTPGPTDGTFEFGGKVHTHPQEQGCPRSCPARSDES